MRVEDFQPIQEINRQELIQERIKSYILANNLRPGSKVPTEIELADQLRVSRATVREAYRSLETLGVVESRPGVGRVVRDFNFDAILKNLSYGMAFQSHNILHTHELRKMLEYSCLEKAIKNLEDEDIQTLSALVERLQRAHEAGDSIDAFRQIDYEFHRLLFERCGNPLALQLFEITWRVAEAAINTDWGYSEISPEWVSDHEAILEAIVRGDVEKARLHTEQHFGDMEQRIRALIEQQQEVHQATVF